MLRRASTGVPVAIDTLDEPYRLPLGARGPAREYTPRQARAGLWRDSEAVIVQMRCMRLEHGWDKYISL